MGTQVVQNIGNNCKSRIPDSIFILPKPDFFRLTYRENIGKLFQNSDSYLEEKDSVVSKSQMKKNLNVENELFHILVSLTASKFLGMKILRDTCCIKDCFVREQILKTLEAFFGYKWKSKPGRSNAKNHLTCKTLFKERNPDGIFFLIVFSKFCT